MSSAKFVFFGPPRPLIAKDFHFWCALNGVSVDARGDFGDEKVQR